MQANGIERLDEVERKNAAPATEAPPIPAAHDARRRRTPLFIAGMWKVLAAQNHAISLSPSLRHTVSDSLSVTS